MAYLILQSRRTRQPQGAARIAAEWAGRVLFAQVGGVAYDPVSGLLASVTGSPGASTTVGGRAFAYTSGVNNHAYSVPDAPFLGALTVFGIVIPASGISTATYINKSSTDNPQQPFYAGFESAYNGLYCVRAQNSPGFKSWRPTSASISAGARSTFAAMWSNGMAFTAPTFWVNGTYSAATQVFTGGSDGAVAGSGGAIKVGNRDSKDACAIELIAVIRGTLSDQEYLSLYANPYQLFSGDRRVLYFGAGAGGGDVLTAISGSAVTSSAGTLVSNVAQAISGSEVTTAAGTVTPVTGATAALSGSAVTVAAGTVSVAVSCALAGSEVTAAAGTVTPDSGTFVALTGAAVTASAGTMSVAVSVALSGSQVTSSAGTLTVPGASIWTDVGVSAATWSDVGGASSIWTDL